MKNSSIASYLVLIFGLIAYSSQAISSKLDGYWILNEEETEKLRTPLDEKKISLPTAGRMNVSVMGIPLPGSGGKASGGFSNLSAKQPELLRAKKIKILTSKETFQIHYLDLGKDEQIESMKRGNYRGRTSSWKASKFEQRYKTTERKVSKKGSLRKDGRLEISVSIKNKKAKKQVTKRVFDPANA